MDYTKTMKEFHQALEQKNWEKVEELLDFDFVFDGPMPKPLGKQDFITTHKDLLGAFSDFNYHLSDLTQEGDVVKGSIQITAKHTGDLNLSSIGGPTVAATGKEIKLGRDTFEATYQNGKIRRIHSIPSKDGGMPALLKAIGVPAPQPQSV